MKHYVLVHGAWGGAWEFAELSRLLAADGSLVIAVDLPGHGDNQTPIAEVTMAAYVRKVTEVIEGLDAKAILLGHSLAGSIISQVAEDIPEKVDRLIYVATSLPRSGDTVLDLMQSDEGGQLLPNILFSEDQSYATINADLVRDLLLHDVEDKQRIESLIPEFLFRQATAPFMAAVNLSEERFGSVAKYYVRATQDKVMSQALQDRMLTHWPVEQIITLDSGHFPLTSMAETLSDAINEFVVDINPPVGQQSPFKPSRHASGVWI
jgi:pimeloyl-ACP methyl ester carboxylesterase